MHLIWDDISRVLLEKMFFCKEKLEIMPQDAHEDREAKKYEKCPHYMRIVHCKKSNEMV